MEFAMPDWVRLLGLSSHHPMFQAPSSGLRIFPPWFTGCTHAESTNACTSVLTAVSRAASNHPFQPEYLEEASVFQAVQRLHMSLRGRSPGTELKVSNLMRSVRSIPKTFEITQGGSFMVATVAPLHDSRASAATALPLSRGLSRSETPK
jgi:hypothetical protein